MSIAINFSWRKFNNILFWIFMLLMSLLMASCHGVITAPALWIHGASMSIQAMFALWAGIFVLIGFSIYMIFGSFKDFNND